MMWVSQSPVDATLVRSVAGHYNCHTRLEAIVATISLAPCLAAKSESVTRLPVNQDQLTTQQPTAYVLYPFLAFPRHYFKVARL